MSTKAADLAAYKKTVDWMIDVAIADDRIVIGPLGTVRGRRGLLITSRIAGAGLSFMHFETGRKADRQLLIDELRRRPVIVHAVDDGWEAIRICNALWPDQVAAGENQKGNTGLKCSDYIDESPQVRECESKRPADAWAAEIVAGINIAKHREVLGDDAVDLIIKGKWGG